MDLCAEKYGDITEAAFQGKKRRIQEAFKKLEEIVDIASMSKEERMRYDESIKVYRDQLAVMEFERNKGLAEGRAEGRAEEKENVARNLKRMGMDVETIAKATGLDPDVIESL